MAINYGKKFDIDLKYGQESEELIKSVFGGEVKVEVKRDDKWPLRTGNVFVEVEYLGEPSGIETTEAEYWIHFWRPGRAFIMETKELKKLVDKALKSGKRVSGGDKMYAQGALVPLEWIVKAD